MKIMNAKNIKNAFTSGAHNLINNQDKINAMNVFPVPDGDTGSNMAGTVNSAILEIKDKKMSTAGEVAKNFAYGMLFGARGNSGVILSQIFKGFAVGFENQKYINALSLVSAFNYAKNYAYKSVIKPVEGTILTVIRKIAEKLTITITKNNDCKDVFAIATETAKDTCLATPNLLPVLKEVGVTDSGGEGLLMFIEGMKNYVFGHPIKKNIKIEATTDKKHKNTLIYEQESYKGEFGYCTELIIELKREKWFNKDKFLQSLKKMGTSIALVKDGMILKIHIHNQKSGTILNFAQKFGKLLKIKIENMTLQANQSLLSKNKIFEKEQQKIKKIAIISCNSGSGFIDEMKKLKTTYVIETETTSLPTAKDFIEIVQNLNAKKIFILPNNTNLILPVQQIIQTIAKEIVVIPTKNQVEGIAAMINFHPEDDFDDAREAMEDALNDVKTGKVKLVTKMPSDLQQKNKYTAIGENKIIKTLTSKVEAAILVCKKLINEDVEIVTIYYGEDCSEIDAKEVQSFVESHYNVSIEIKYGGQKNYNFLMGFE